ncbi:MAG: TonB-dependent receptor [Spirochaetaceae bacterium]
MAHRHRTGDVLILPRSAIAAILVAALLFCVLQESVRAQESEDEESPGATEIVVTVTAPPLPALEPLESEARLPEPLLAPDSLAELLLSFPGLTLSSYSEEPRQSSLQYRGYTGSHLPLVVDGAVVNPSDLGRLPWGSVPAAAVESARLLRGPQAARYGSGAITGVLLIETSPRHEEGYFQGSAGSFGYLSAEAGATQQVGQALVKAAGELYRQDGQRENSDSAGGSTLASVYRPGEDSPEIEATLGYSQVTYGLPGSISPEQFEQDPDKAGTPDDRGESNRIHGTVDLNWEVGTGELNLPIYLEYRSDRADFVSLGTTTDTETVTARLEPGMLLFLSGQSARRRDPELYGGFAGEMVRLASTADTGTTTEQTFLRPGLGIYGGAMVPVMDSWSLDFGARYDLAFLEGSGAIEESSTLQGLGGDAALRYEAGITESILQIAAVYRLPKIDEIASYQGFGLSFNPDLGPENGLAIDLGSRVAPAEAFSLRAGLFAIFLRDEIAFSAESGRNENIDSTRRLGGEADAEFRITDGLRVGGGYSFVDARYASGDDEGTPLPRVPRHSVSSSVGWAPTVWLELSADYRMVGRYYDEADDNSAARYRRDILDLSAAFTLPTTSVEWSLGLAGENLLDDRDPAIAFPGFGSFPAALYPTPGRRFRVSLGGSY